MNLSKTVRFRLHVLSKTFLPTVHDTSVRLASAYFYYNFYTATNLGFTYFDNLCHILTVVVPLGWGATRPSDPLAYAVTNHI